MTKDSELSMEFLCNVQYLLQTCGPDADADAVETEAAARVAGRLAAWLGRMAPSGVALCEYDGCALPATDWLPTGRRCPYHDTLSASSG